jgi:transcriptional regulator with XRE-family HTH domain
MTTKKRIFGIKDLENKFGPMTLGLFLRSLRQTDNLSQVEFARRLGLSRANLCDIEKGRKQITPDRAAKIAARIGVPEAVLVQLTIQDSLRSARLHYLVTLKAA